MNKNKSVRPLPAAIKPLNQQGMAALVITMVTMVVITLIVVGFATISRREQRQSLDQLLSSQAFYAAESGVEDVRNAIRNWQDANPAQAIPSKKLCTDNDSGGDIYPKGDDMRVDSDYDVAYTCLKVNSAPGDLKFDGLNADAVIVPVTTAQPITSLKIVWKPKAATGSPNADCPAAPSATNRVLKPQSGPNAWTCKYGILRADIVPTNNGGTVTAASLASSQLTAFFVPTNSGGTGNLAYATNSNAHVVVGDCNTPATVYSDCTATITGLPANTKTLSLRLSSLYQPGDVVVQAFDGSTTQGITGAQVEVDSTGRASDVLRRIKVRIPVSQSAGTIPGTAMTSNGTICKRFFASSGYFKVPDIIDRDTSNQMCTPQSDDASFGP